MVTDEDMEPWLNEGHGMWLQTDDDGWMRATCDCGWTGYPCPGQIEAVDSWADHIEGSS